MRRFRLLFAAVVALLILACAARRFTRGHRRHPQERRPRDDYLAESRLQGAVEPRQHRAWDRRGVHHRRAAHHHERARHQQLALTSPSSVKMIRRNTPRRSSSLPMIATSRCWMWRTRVFQEPQAVGNRRYPGAGIQRLGLRLSHRRRAHERDARHRLTHRLPDVHPFVGGQSSRLPDRRGDQPG